MNPTVLTEPTTYLQLRDLSNYVFLLALVLVPALELSWPRYQTPIRELMHHTGRNIGLWLCGVLITSIPLGSLMVMMMYWLEINQVGLLYQITLPLPVMLIVGVLILDFADYLFHRVSHQVRWLWLLHAVHHSDTAVDFSTALRTHPLHILLILGWKLALLAAFGIPIWVFMVREVLAVPVNLFHHGRFRLSDGLDRRLRRLIVSPAMHRLHHSPRFIETNSNYSTLFSFWDRIFGTYIEATPQGTASTGLDALNGNRWQTVWGLLATPWHARRYERM